MSKKTISKWMHEFFVSKETEIPEIQTSKNENGEEVTITKQVKVLTPVKFKIKRPNRRLYEEAELFHAVKISEGIKAGLLTKGQLVKRFEDDGGIFSEEDRKKYMAAYISLINLETEIQRFQLNSTLPKEEKEKKISDAIIDAATTRREIQEYERIYSSFFDKTAEFRADTQLIMWWVLHLGLIEESGIDKCIFGESSFESKLSKYDEIEESGDVFLLEAIKKLAYFISFWNTGRLSNEEDFKQAEDIYNENNEPDVEVEDNQKSPAST